jgi:hypothetical protein
MKKFFLWFLFCYATSCFAAQCPLPENWSHQQGQEWQLSPDVAKDGWQVMQNPEAIKSDFTSIPVQNILRVGILKTGHAYSSCTYILDEKNPDLVVTAANFEKRISIESVKKNFICIHEFCRCNTSAGDVEKCAWEWSH